MNEENEKKLKKNREKIEKRIEKALMLELGLKGLLKPHYVSLVSDYIEFWRTKQKLFDDIEDRGIVCKYDNGGGQCGYKKNDSVSEVVKISSQMNSILRELGLRGADLQQAVIDDEI